MDPLTFKAFDNEKLNDVAEEGYLGVLTVQGDNVPVIVWLGPLVLEDLLPLRAVYDDNHGNLRVGMVDEGPSLTPAGRDKLLKEGCMATKTWVLQVIGVC